MMVLHHGVIDTGIPEDITTGLLYRYKLDQLVSTKFANSVPPNSLPLTPTSVTVASGSPVGNYASSAISTAKATSGSIVQVPFNSLVYSVSFWVIKTSVNVLGWIWGSGSYTAGGISCYTNSGASNFSLTYYFGSIPGWSPNTISIPGLAYNTWVHVVLTADGTNMRMYRDGVAVGNPVALNTWVNSGSQHFQLFQTENSPASGLAGGIADFRIYNRALSATDVNRLHSFRP